MISKSKPSLPWVNACLKRMCKKRQRLLSRAKRTRKPSHSERYKAHKRVTLKEIGRTRWSYINDILNLSLTDKNSEPFWRCIRSQRSDSFGVSALKENGQLFSDGTKKADILNQQFASVFTRDSGESWARLYALNYPAIKPLTIDQNGVEKLLQGLNVSKASGPDYPPPPTPPPSPPVASWRSLLMS